jgi:nitroreductase
VPRCHRRRLVKKIHFGGYDVEALTAIYSRRSTRNYLGKEVDRDTIITLLKAATAAPTAANYQPWEFIVVDEYDKLVELKKEIVFARYNAPVAIVVCGNMKLALKGPDRDMWIQDCSAAIENILIAATSLGLGSVWIGIYPVENRVRTLKKIFNIQEDVIPLSIVYIGYPAEVIEPRTQYNEKRVYWQEYEPKRKHRVKDKPNRS